MDGDHIPVKRNAAIAEIPILNKSIEQFGSDFKIQGETDTLR